MGKDTFAKFILFVLGVLVGLYMHGYIYEPISIVKKETQTKTDTLIEYEEVILNEVKYRFDTSEVRILEVDTVYRDVPCYSDTTREYVLSGGDSIVKTSDTLEIKGVLLNRRQFVHYAIPQKTIREETTVFQQKEVGRHRLYLVGSTDATVGLMYGNEWVTAGYRYSLNRQQHIGEVGINLFRLFRK